jgi:putative Holliday junction resolvase
VGVAVTDELGLYAHPRCTLAAKPRDALLRELANIVREDKVETVVLGLPLDMRGHEGEAARKARRFAQEVANATGCDVELWDERLTTVEAMRRLADNEVRGKRARARVDQEAAVHLLQSWLDRRRGSIADG